MDYESSWRWKPVCTSVRVRAITLPALNVHTFRINNTGTAVCVCAQHTTASHIQFSFTYGYEFIFFLSIIFPCMYFLASDLRFLNARGARFVRSHEHYIYFSVYFIHKQQREISISFLFHLFFSPRSLSLSLTLCLSRHQTRLAGGVCMLCVREGLSDKAANEHWIFSINIWTCSSRFFLSSSSHRSYTDISRLP